MVEDEMTKALTTFFIVAVWLSIVGYAAHVLTDNIASALDDQANLIAKASS
jgi:hypothetical protein